MNAGQPADLRFEDIVEGAVFGQTYTITVEVFEAFIACSGDRSPIHVDDAFAHSSGFRARVAHGTILNAFVSHFVGMCVPGRRALLHSVDLRYVTPCAVGDTVRLSARVAQKSSSSRVFVLHLEFHDVPTSTLVARGRAQIGVL
jgi:3-hydroxybutyryl-CoA dehydratase